MHVSIIPGLITPQGGRLLLVITGVAKLPPVRVRAASAGVNVGADVRILRSGTRLDDELLRRHTWTAQIELGAIAGAVVGVEVKIGNHVARNTVPVVPTELPPEGLTVAAGTCFYDYFPTTGASTYRQQLVFGRWFGRPKLKILAGDNLYLDVAPGQLYRSGAYAETAEYYTHYFGPGAYSELLAGECTVTCWDDHEFWNNYPEQQGWLSRSWPSNREAYATAALAAIDLFQAPLNPEPTRALGRSYQFDLGPLKIFVADTRSQRTPHDVPRPRAMHELELLALTQWARGLTGPGILVMGQPIWDGPGSNVDWMLAAFEKDYGSIWAALADAPYDIMVLSGDVHYSRAIEVRVGRGSVFEVLTSPAVHIPSEPMVAVGSLLGASLGGQGTDALTWTDSVKLDPAFGLKPRLTRKIFGHGRPNTFALLQFRGTADRIDVGLAFIDHQHGRVAASEGGEYQECFATTAFSLKRR